MASDEDHRDTTTTTTTTTTADTTSAEEGRFNLIQELQHQHHHLSHHHQANYHLNQAQHQQYLSLCDKHDSNRFVQQQQQLYENHQEHKGFIESPCNCYQSGGSQICSRCQTAQEQNHAGAFVYQPIQADDAPQSRLQLQQNLQQTIQSTGYSPPTPTTTSSSSPSSLGNNGKHLDSSAFQEPIYESNVKYYLKQQPSDDGYNNNNTPSQCAESSQLISESLSCQTTFSFNNNNNDNISLNNNDNNNLIIENVASSGGLFYQCSSNNNNNSEAAQYANYHDANDDWKEERSLVETSSSDQDKLLFGSTNLDNNNNNNNNNNSATTQLFSSAQYPMTQIIQEINKSPCLTHHNQQHQQQQQQHHHNQQFDTNQFTSIQPQFNSYQPPYGGTPIRSSTTNQQQMIVLDAESYSSAPQERPSQLAIQLQQENCGPSTANSSSSGQSCFSSSSDGSSYQQSAVDQLSSSSAVSSKSRARRKNPAALSKVNGKLWEFIRDLLLSDRTNPAFIRWERREDGVFKFVESNKVAKMWGERKQNPKMTYEKLSRAMRYYYKSKVLLPVFGRRLVYKFGPNASGWNDKTE